MEKITVTIKPNGNTLVAVNGVKGAACKNLTADLEKALGKVESDTATEEMNEQANPEVLNQY